MSRPSEPSALHRVIAKVDRAASALLGAMIEGRLPSAYVTAAADTLVKLRSRSTVRK